MRQALETCFFQDSFSGGRGGVRRVWNSLCIAHTLIPGCVFLSLQLSIRVCIPCALGCDSIICICGHVFCWSELVKNRNMRVANAFRDAHPEDTARVASQIIRRGPPPHATNADAQQVHFISLFQLSALLSVNI